MGETEGSMTGRNGNGVVICKGARVINVTGKINKGGAFQWRERQAHPDIYFWSQLDPRRWRGEGEARLVG